MGRQRKYLERGRRIALEGRPFETDWLTLLGAGQNAVQRGRADDAPFLSEVMWEGVSAIPHFPRPAALDHPFLRSALACRESETMTYVKEQWETAWVTPLPAADADVLEALDRPDCITAGAGGHLMTAHGAALPGGTVTWYTGYCAGCMRAMLLRIDDEYGSVRFWPFYDQDAVGQ